MATSMAKRLSRLVVLSGLLGSGILVAQSATTLPDAQVESNVLKALAGAPELSTQNIQSTVVYGTVTLSGNVHDEALRVKAENLVARTEGVKKVVDQLTLGDTPAPAEQAAATPTPEAAQGGDSQQGVLQSDGTYAPAPGSAPQPNPEQAGNMGPQQGGAQAPPQQGPPPQQGRQPMYQNYGPGGPPPVQGGQRAGIAVTVPAGATLRIRINRGLDSQHIQPGATFDGTVLADVIAGGAVAIPRGATIQGTVVDAKKAGVFKGQGELALQLTGLTLGGSQYPLQTQVWQRDGKDKTVGTVNRTVGTSAFGAIVGALAGGGEGAAIGAGVGAGAGLASSAGSPRGQIIIPPESVLTFTTAAPTVVKTVSEAEMARLSYAAGPGPQPQRPMRRYYSPYYGYYYGPAY
jgi:hypothetical protein